MHKGDRICTDCGEVTEKVEISASSTLLGRRYMIDGLVAYKCPRCENVSLDEESMERVSEKVNAMLGIESRK